MPPLSREVLQIFPHKFQDSWGPPPISKKMETFQRFLLFVFLLWLLNKSFFSVLIFFCVFIYDVLFVNVRVLTIWQMIRASVMSFITGAPVVKIIKLYHHFFPLKS